MMRTPHILQTLVLATMACIGTAAGAHAAPIIVPPGLAPGSTYRLIFYTSAAHDATSTDIDVYNQFVTAVANGVPELAALSTTWHVLASTQSVNALNNAGLDVADTTTPFFNTRSELIATGVTSTTSSLYGGPQTRHGSGIDDEFGNNTNVLVFTGTSSSGQTSFPLGDNLVFAGLSKDPIATWTTLQFNSSTASDRLYAISGVLTVPAAVPEPGTIWTLACGGLLLTAGAFRKRVNRT